MMNLKTYKLAVTFYKNCQQLKFSNRHLKDQFQRSSLSICLNIAEGAGRLTPKDRARFFTIALGSLRESQCLLELINQKDLTKQADLLGAHLYKLAKNPGGT